VSTDSEVVAIDLSTNSVVAQIGGFENAKALAMSPDGDVVYVADYSSGRITSIDTATDLISADITTTTHPGSLALTPDGRSLFIADQSDFNLRV
jgi:YVTN family beta-propeller protein